MSSLNIFNPFLFIKNKLTEQESNRDVVIKEARARICKLLRSPEMDYKESNPPSAYVAWRDGTTNKVIIPTRQAKEAGGIDSLPSIYGLLKV